MPPDSAIATISHVIQLSIAPVFLLNGIGAILGVLTSRVARIIDRSRALEARLAAGDSAPAPLHAELATLAQRAMLMNWAINLSTTCALLVCLVIVALFAGASLGVNVSPFITGLFILAMLALIGGLLGFLREIYLSTANLRIGTR